MTAEDCLAKRFAALASGDYATVYATYHAESPFLQQFAGRDEYLLFARQQLAEIEVKHWRSLRQRSPKDGRQEHLLVMELSVAGASQYFYELALLLETVTGWRYHSAQKLSGEDYSGPPEEIQFVHFDRVTQVIRY